MEPNTNINKGKISSYTEGNTISNSEISLKGMVLELRNWVKFLLGKWMIISTVAIISGIGFLLYNISKATLYKAELTFVLEEERSSPLGNYAAIAGQFGIDAGGGSSVFSGSNLLTFMKSRSIIQSVLLKDVDIKNKKITLADLYIDINKDEKLVKWAIEEKLNFPINSDPSKFDLEHNSLMGAIHNNIINTNLSIDKKDKKTSIITLGVTSENELFSKFFTEALGKEVSDFYIKTRTQKSASNLALLQHEADSINRLLNYSISSAAATIDATPNLNPSRQILRVPSQRKQIDVQATQLMYAEMIRNLQMAKISLRNETPLIQVIDPPILPLEKIEPNKIRGFIVGFILGGMLAAGLLVVQRLFKGLMDE